MEINAITQREVVPMEIGPASKIKLRSVSHANLVEHLKNVPYESKRPSKTSVSNTPKSDVPVFEKNVVKMIEGKSKLINVKEAKTNNIRKHVRTDSLVADIANNVALKYSKLDNLDMTTSIPVSKILESQNTAVASVPIAAIPGKRLVEEQKELKKEQEEVQSSVVPFKKNEKIIEENMNIDEKAVEEKVQANVDSFDNNKSVLGNTSMVSETSPNETVNVIKETETDTVIDISEYISKINNETQMVKEVKNKANEAQKEAEESEENLNKISVEVSELEKQEIEAIKRDKALDREVVQAYQSQTKTLAVARRKYTEIIDAANNRKKTNQEKISKFESKLNGIKENLTAVNESIARKESLINALQQTASNEIDNIIPFSNAEQEEVAVKRIA